MEIFVCKLTGDFMSGIKASKSRYHSQRTPRFYRYIGYGKSEIKIIKIGLSALWQRNM